MEIYTDRKQREDIVEEDKKNASFSKICMGIVS